MASITNRSNYLVTVEDEPSLTERFPFSESAQAKSYLRELKKRGKPACVASATSGQIGSAKMRDFELLRAPRRQSEVDEQARISTIHSGAEDRDPA